MSRFVFSFQFIFYSIFRQIRKTFIVLFLDFVRYLFMFFYTFGWQVVYMSNDSYRFLDFNNFRSCFMVIIVIYWFLNISYKISTLRLGNHKTQSTPLPLLCTSSKIPKKLNTYIHTWENTNLALCAHE